MTRRDYVLIADALRNACPAGSRDVCSPNSAAYTAWLASVCGVSAALGRTNPKFESDRFLLACGVIL